MTAKKWTSNEQTKKNADAKKTSSKNSALQKAQNDTFEEIFEDINVDEIEIDLDKEKKQKNKTESKSKSKDKVESTKKSTTTKKSTKKNTPSNTKEEINNSKDTKDSKAPKEIKKNKEAASKKWEESDKKPNINIKDAGHMIAGIWDLDAYIKNKKASEEKTKEENKEKKNQLVFEELVAMDGTDLHSIDEAYAVLPHAKGDHKIIMLRDQAPDKLREDTKWRVKWSEYIKSGTKIYDVHVDFKRHPTLKNTQWDHLDIRLIDEPQDLENQLKAIKNGKWGGKNFWVPVIVEDWTNTWSKEKLEEKKLEEKKEAIPVVDDVIDIASLTDIDPMDPITESIPTIPEQDSEDKNIDTERETANDLEPIIDIAALTDIEDEMNPQELDIPPIDTETPKNTKKELQINTQKNNVPPQEKIEPATPVTSSPAPLEIDIDALTDMDGISDTSDVPTTQATTQPPKTSDQGLDLDSLTNISDQAPEHIPQPEPSPVPEHKEILAADIKENTKEHIKEEAPEKDKKTSKKTSKDTIADIKNEQASLAQDYDEEDLAKAKAEKYRKRLFLAMKIFGLLFLLWLGWVFYKIAFSNTISKNPESEVITIPREYSDTDDDTTPPARNDVDYDDMIILPEWEPDDTNTEPEIAPDTPIESWDNEETEQIDQEATQVYRDDLVAKLEAQKRESRTLLNKARLIDNAESLQYAVWWYTNADNTLKEVESDPESLTADQLQKSVDRVQRYIDTVREMIE